MDLGLILLLILLNGLFAMAEIAVVSSRKARLQRLADERQPGALTALALQEGPARFLSTIQVGITTVGVLSGAIGETLLADPLAEWLRQFPPLTPYAKGIALGVTVLLITYLSVVIGELTPKRLALRAPERIAMLIARPMHHLSRLASPLVWLLSFSSTLLVRLFGVRHQAEPAITDEEIQILMEEGSEAGIFHQSEPAIVANVLQLDELPVAAIMRPRHEIYAIDLETSAQEQLQRVAESPHSRLPVCRGGLKDVVGVLHRDDLLKPALQGTTLDVKQAIHPPLYVQESLTGTALLERFRQSRQEFALIVDEFDDLQGIVTLRDVLNAIVGDFPAEQNSTTQMTRRQDGSWLVDGSTGIERLKRTLAIDSRFPDEDGNAYNTLAGLIMHCLQRVPSVTDHVEIDGWRFEVVDMDRTRIDKVLIVPPSDTQH